MGWLCSGWGVLWDEKGGERGLVMIENCAVSLVVERTGACSCWDVDNGVLVDGLMDGCWGRWGLRLVCTESGIFY
jgi:hypothetical protein